MDRGFAVGRRVRPCEPAPPSLVSRLRSPKTDACLALLCPPVARITAVLSTLSSLPPSPPRLEPTSHSTAPAARCQSMAVSVRSFPVIP